MSTHVSSGLVLPRASYADSRDIGQCPWLIQTGWRSKVLELGDAIVGALVGGGAAVARSEAARLTQGAMLRLSRRGRAGRELAVIAETLARGSDEGVAAELDRLNEQERTAAGRQLDEALRFDGDDPRERQATDELRELAQHVAQQLNITGPVIGHNTGTVWNVSGGTVHAPGSVGRDYIAGDQIHGDKVAGDKTVHQRSRPTPS
jgi:hypothetical protein